MENSGKLIILLTSSVHDRGQLRNKANWPNKGIAYLDCDQGLRCSDKPLQGSARILSVLLENKDIAGNTNDVTEVLTACPQFQAVVGTHTGQNPPSTVLNLSALPSAVPVAAYTTASEIYHFVYLWCKELAKDLPEPHKVYEGFDKLFALLKGERAGDQVGGHQPAGPAGNWSKMKHDLMNLLEPIVIDFRGWARSGFNDGYFDTGLPQSFPIDPVRYILYGSKGSDSETMEKAINKCLGSSFNPETKRQVEASWNSLQKLLPRPGEPEGSLLQAATQAIADLDTKEGRNKLKIQLRTDNPVVQWISAIKAELNLLSEVMKTQCP